MHTSLRLILVTLVALTAFAATPCHAQIKGEIRRLSEFCRAFVLSHSKDADALLPLPTRATLSPFSSFNAADDTTRTHEQSIHIHTTTHLHTGLCTAITCASMNPLHVGGRWVNTATYGTKECNGVAACPQEECCEYDPPPTCATFNGCSAGLGKARVANAVAKRCKARDCTAKECCIDLCNASVGGTPGPVCAQVVLMSEPEALGLTLGSVFVDRPDRAQRTCTQCPSQTSGKFSCASIGKQVVPGGDGSVCTSGGTKCILHGNKTGPTASAVPAILRCSPGPTNRDACFQVRFNDVLACRVSIITCLCSPNTHFLLTHCFCLLVLSSPYQGSTPPKAGDTTCTVRECCYPVLATNILSCATSQTQAVTCRADGNKLVVPYSHTVQCIGGTCTTEQCCVPSCDSFDCSAVTTLPPDSGMRYEKIANADLFPCPKGPRGCHKDICCVAKSPQTCGDAEVTCPENVKKRDTKLTRECASPTGCTPAECCVGIPTCATLRCEPPKLSEPSSKSCLTGSCTDDDCCYRQKLCSTFDCERGVPKSEVPANPPTTDGGSDGGGEDKDTGGGDDTAVGGDSSEEPAAGEEGVTDEGASGRRRMLLQFDDEGGTYADDPLKANLACRLRACTRTECCKKLPADAGVGVVTDEGLIGGVSAGTVAAMFAGGLVFLAVLGICWHCSQNTSSARAGRVNGGMNNAVL
jgi:hypothetical protein